MYFTFFKRNIRQQAPDAPIISPEDEEVDSDDDDMFIRAEKIFYRYYSFLKDQKIWERKGKPPIIDEDPYVDSDEEFRVN
jgi:hypothetical protein